MRRFNICTRRTYKKDGVEKVQWPQVGTMVHFDANGQNKEGYKIELPIFGNTQFFVFEAVDRRAPQAPAQPTAPEYPTEEINPQDIPY